MIAWERWRLYAASSRDFRSLRPLTHRNFVPLFRYICTIILIDESPATIVGECVPCPPRSPPTRLWNGTTGRKKITLLHVYRRALRARETVAAVT
uniref:Transposase n=1 Tax=Steinernema glaseri TaxID=37863 RepID=A0A1I7Z3E1_9BILA